jgi:uncharacterized Ntn-hydrolase superfamily protein
MSVNEGRPPGPLLSTFSIVGRSADGLLGVAVTSRVLAVGASCPFVRASRVAISSQAYLNPYLAIGLIEGVEAGADVASAAGAVLEADDLREWRQLVAIGVEGPGFAHSGNRIDPWAGHRLGRDCVVAGNLLVGAGTVDAMIEAFEAGTGRDLPARLLDALAEGQAAGGDRRGRQSAALLVAGQTEIPYIDLRVDDHPDPVAELQRIHGLMGPEGLAKARRTATSRIGRSEEELVARQAEVRAALEREGR